MDDVKRALTLALATYFKRARAEERAYRAMATAAAYVEENPDDGRLWAAYGSARDSYTKARTAADAAADRYRAVVDALDALDGHERVMARAKPLGGDEE